MPNNEIERRSTTGEVKTEARTLTGYCARYDSPTVIGSGENAFTEVILKGAFRSCIERADDIAFLREHQPTMLLARTPKTLKVAEDSAGLRFVAEMPDTQLAEETLQLVQNGTLQGMSFSFSLGPNDDSWSMEKDSAGKSYVLRKIRNFQRVMDQSICLWPAYANTSISARALEARSSIAARAGIVTEGERLKMLDRANRKRLEWVTREIAKDDAADDDPDPDSSDDAFDLEDDFRCQRCGSRSFRCLGCGTIGGGQK